MNMTKIFLLIGILTSMTACLEGSGSGSSSSSSSSTTTTTTTTTTTSTTTTTLAVNRKSVGMGEGKSFAIDASGNAKSWGANIDAVNGSNGQLGQNISANVSISTPTALSGTSTYVAIVGGELLGCGLTSDYHVKCWGDLTGDGTGATKYAPALIDDGGTSTYVDIATGSYHGCAVSTAGVLKCWGDGWDGKLGNGDATGATQNSPVTADPGTTYKRVAAGRNHTCGITTSGALKCWGTNGAGQIGDTTTTSPRTTPVTIDVGTTYKEIAAGEDTTCGITTAGVLKCWGSNGDGQIGDNSQTDRPTPTVVDSGTTYTKVSVGGTYNIHTCAITTAGVLKCWGDNSAGQLGIGSTTRALTPTTVESGTTYREVAAFWTSSCGITTAGVLKCWGANGSGQLGLGNTNNVVANRSPQTVGSGY